MQKKLAGRTGIIVATLVIFTYFIFFGSGLPKKGSVKQLLTNSIHLGLDLKGGTHLVLQVHVAEAVAAQTDSDVARLQTDLAKAGVTGAQVAKLDPTKVDIINVANVTAADTAKARGVLNGTSYSSTYDVASVPNGYTLTMKQQSRKEMESTVLQTSIETIRQRVDSLGVAEPVIQQYGLGDNQILIELPGISNADEVHNAIQSTARLEIHEVVGGPAATEAEALQTLGGSLPPDDMVVKGASSVTAAGNSDMFYVLKRVAIVSGTDFRGAQPVRDPNTGQSQTSFNLTSGAGERFYEFTSANVGKGIAVVLENRVRSVASIKSAIHDSGVIEGLSEDEAKNLSLMLRTGSLPASISYLDTLTVGPSLGAASITHGVYAAVAGMLAVMFFMLLYYRGAGINADLALVLNLVILLGFMGLTGSTLTLPGIAGVILTIGMGVDSNVLIFERIREELHLGRTPSAAVQNGFAHAWITIIDTHVTTIVSAAILFLFGTGPVRGFAVTLTFGLLANIFTAVFVSRTIFDAILNRKQRGEALSI